MGNTPKNRPAVGRAKTSRRAADKRKEELQQEVAFRVNGTVYGFRLGDLTSWDLLCLRREAGMSLAALGEAMQEGDLGPEIIAVFVWLARRADGEDMLKLRQVAQEITLAVDVESVDSGEVEGEVVEIKGEASGGSS